jgi:hypothetical protein
MTLHVVYSRKDTWWVPEEVGEKVTGRVTFVGEPAIPNTSMVPGEKIGQVVGLQCQNGGLKVWIVRSQVQNPDLLRKRAFVTITCGVPDIGYSEDRHYGVRHGADADITDLASEEIIVRQHARRRKVDAQGHPNALIFEEPEEEEEPENDPARDLAFVDFCLNFTNAAMSGYLGASLVQSVRRYAELLDYDLDDVAAA